MNEPVAAAPRQPTPESLPPDAPRAEAELSAQAWKALSEPAQRRRGNPALWALLSLAAFMLVFGASHSLRSLAMLLGVLLFHEAGHWAGMKAFGYRDVRVFFIPGAGALMSGQPGRARGWQEAIVLLLGPLPGLILACVLSVWNLWSPHAVLTELIPWLVGLNAFNLLPFAPLDGGALLNLVLFSRHRALEALFVAASGLALLAIGLSTQMLFLVALGVFGLLMVPFRYRLARAASSLRQRWPEMPAEPTQADEALRHALFTEARKLWRHAAAPPTPGPLARLIEDLHRQANVPPMSARVAAGLLAAYLGAVGLATCGGILQSRIGRSFGIAMRAARHIGEGAYDAGQRDLSEAIRTAPENAVLYQLRAELWTMQGQPTRALADYEEAIRLFEQADRHGLEDGLAYNSAAWIYATGPEALRDPAKALQLAEKAAARAQDNANVLNTLGVAHYRLGHFDQAATTLERALRARHGSGDGLDWIFLCLSHQGRGDRAKAREAYDKALRWLDTNPAGSAPDRGVFEEARGAAEAALSRGASASGEGGAPGRGTR